MAAASCLSVGHCKTASDPPSEQLLLPCLLSSIWLPGGDAGVYQPAAAGCLGAVLPPSGHPLFSFWLLSLALLSSLPSFLSSLASFLFLLILSLSPCLLRPYKKLFFCLMPLRRRRARETDCEERVDHCPFSLATFIPLLLHSRPQNFAVLSLFLGILHT